MKILSIKINNILSIEQAEVTFDDTGLMLVKGWDYDSNRANGAGKTSIFNALSFALYDKLPRKITATEIVRRGCKSGTVEVTVEISSVQYTVRRSRPKGVSFSAGGLEVSMTQDEWESKLGLNYNQFTMVAYCSQGSSTRFLSVNDADKKKFLLQLLDLDSFALAKKRADDVVKEHITAKDKLESDIRSTKSRIEAYSETLIDEAETNNNIVLIQSNLSILNDQLLEAASVQKPDLVKYESLEEDLNTKRLTLTKIRAKREVLHDEYRRTNNKIKPFTGASECDACGSHLDTTQAKATHEKEIENLKIQLATLKSQIDEADLALLKEPQLNELLNKIKNKKKEESHDYGIASVRAGELRLKIQHSTQKLSDLTIKLQNNDELINKINKLQGALDNVNLKLVDYQSKIDLYKTVSAMYSPTGAQAYILDSIVELFNESVTQYINSIWDSATYELLSYKENQGGDVSAKFSEKLTINGHEISIGSLSGGEYRALSLCVDFALIKVMERQFGIFISPIILDEPFDGLDSEGRELVIDLLQLISDTRHIIVIDHASETKSMFSKVLTVEKRNGISSINLEA